MSGVMGNKLNVVCNMTNPYKVHLDSFFETIIEFRHSSNRLNKVLLKDVERYTAEGAQFFSGTSLAIGDWTGPTDNGWKLTFHTGVRKITRKENYAHDVDQLLSREFGLALSQCYEAMETLFKDLVHTKSLNDESFKTSLSLKKVYSREQLKGGDDLFKILKKAGGHKFSTYSNKNNNSFKFRELFKTYSEVRHAITHSRGCLMTSKIPNTTYYQGLFQHLFPNHTLSGEVILLDFDYPTLDRNLIYISEFGFQMFKILSEEDGFEWKFKNAKN